MSWAHTRVLSVTIGDELTLYPVPVRLTEAVFKSLANGGQCLTAHDLAFYSLAGALLPFDKRVHDLTTGEISYWVGVDPADATFVMTWGDATVTAALEDASGVWDDEYEAVWHLDENAATTDYLDATSHGHVSVTAPVNSEDRFVADGYDLGIGLNGTDYGIQLEAGGVVPYAAPLPSALASSWQPTTRPGRRGISARSLREPRAPAWGISSRSIARAICLFRSRIHSRSSSEPQRWRSTPCIPWPLRSMASEAARFTSAARSTPQAP